MNEKKKPTCVLSNQNGNILHLMGLASRVLKRVKMYEEEKEMQEKVLQSASYDEALQVIMKYVEVV